MKRYEINKGKGDQLCQFLAACNMFMLFVEEYYANKCDFFGLQPYEQVVKIHKMTKTFMESHALWKAGSKERKETKNKNKLLRN